MKKISSIKKLVITKSGLQSENSIHNHNVKCKMVVVLFCAVLSRINCVRLFATPRTVAHQAPLSMGFPRQEHWSGLLLPSPKCKIPTF